MIDGLVVLRSFPSATDIAEYAHMCQIVSNANSKSLGMTLSNKFKHCRNLTTLACWHLMTCRRSYYPLTSNDLMSIIKLRPIRTSNLHTQR